jgi:hypothetical protein
MGRTGLFSFLIQHLTIFPTINLTPEIGLYSLGNLFISNLTVLEWKPDVSATIGVARKLLVIRNAWFRALKRIFLDGEMTGEVLGGPGGGEGEDMGSRKGTRQEGQEG